MTNRQNHGPFYQGRSSASVGRERTGKVVVGGTFYNLGGVTPSPAPSPASALVDFEVLGLAATSAGTPVGTTYLASAGLTFSANALAFHKGTGTNDDPLGAFLKPPASSGYARTSFSASLPIGGSGYGAFTVSVSGRTFTKFSLLLAVAELSVEIYAYDAGGNILNTSAHLFANAGGMAWTGSPYVLVDGTGGGVIDNITFNASTRGSFAIDDLLFA